MTESYVCFRSFEEICLELCLLVYWHTSLHEAQLHSARILAEPIASVIKAGQKMYAIGSPKKYY
jgi:hypothetical protein